MRPKEEDVHDKSSLFASVPCELKVLFPPESDICALLSACCVCLHTRQLKASLKFLFLNKKYCIPMFFFCLFVRPFMTNKKNPILCS